MGEHRPYKALLRLAAPLYVAQMAMVASGLIDTLMAGHLSTLDLAALSVAASLQTTITMVIASLLMALPVLIAHRAGAGDLSGVGREVAQGLSWVVLLSLLAIALLGHPDAWIGIAALPAPLSGKVIAYLQASAWGVPALLLLRVFMGLFSGLSRPRPVMLVNLVYLGLKPALNLLCLRGLGLGVEGCALAAAIDAWLLCAAALFWLLRQDDLAPLWRGWRLSLPDAAGLKDILHIGLPIALTFIADLTAFTLMALLIARLGTVAAAAHQIAASLVVLAYMWPMAVGNASTLLIGQALGSGDPPGARRHARQALRLALLCALPVSLGLALLAPHIAAVYSPDSQVQALASRLIMAVALYHLADAVQVVAVSALRGYQHTVIPMLVYTLGLWGLGLGGGYLLGLSDRLLPHLGSIGFWIAAVISLGSVALSMVYELQRISQRALIAPSRL